MIVTCSEYCFVITTSNISIFINNIKSTHTLSLHSFCPKFDGKKSINHETHRKNLVGLQLEIVLNWANERAMANWNWIHRIQKGGKSTYSTDVKIDVFDSFYSPSNFDRIEWIGQRSKLRDRGTYSFRQIEFFPLKIRKDENIPWSAYFKHDFFFGCYARCVTNMSFRIHYILLERREIKLSVHSQLTLYVLFIPYGISLYNFE